MAPNDPPSYRDHPRYSLRRFIILSGILGIFLSVPALSPYQHRDLSNTFLSVIFWLVGSLAVCLWDLVDWKIKATASLVKTGTSSTERQPLLASTTTDDQNGSVDSSDGDDKPDRPRMLLFFLDLFLAVALFLVWIDIVSTIQMSFSYSQYYIDIPLVMSSTYASVTVVLNSLAHLLCMWKEFMAMKKTDWEQTLRRNRLEWEERLNRMVAAAVQPQQQGQTVNAEEHRTGHHTCTCYTGSTGERVREENKIVERIMRVLGKLVEEPDLLSRQINDDPSSTIRKRHDDYDIEAGPSYQHESLLTPSQSASTTEVGPDSVDTLHTGSETPSDQILVVGETSSDALEAVVVKKKVKKGGSAKGKEKALPQEQEQQVQQEQRYTEEN